VKSCFDKSFRYTPSHETNIRETFERVRRELAAKAEKEAKNLEEAKVKVAAMNTKRKA